VAGEYAALTDIDKIGRMAVALQAAGRDVAFDLETGYSSSEPDRERGALDWDWDKQFVVGFSFSWRTGFARYVPLRHDSGGNVEDVAATWEAMRPLLTKGNITAHHAKFEERGVLKDAGYVIASEGGYLEDTMLMAYAMGGTLRKPKEVRASYGLKDLVEIVCEYRMTHIAELFPKLTGKQERCLRFNVLDVSDPKVIAYACEDAAWTLELRQRIRAEALAKRPRMFKLEHLISRLMAEVEAYGVAVDWEAMTIALSDSHAFVLNMEKVIKQDLSEQIGRDVSNVSLNSPKQMRELLYSPTGLGLTTTRLTASADKQRAENPDVPHWQLMSTDEAAMNGLSKKNTAVKKLLEYREALNMQARLSNWVNEVRPYSRDGRVHATYRQAGAEDSAATAPGSGRFSAADPAIQQCPKEWRWSCVLGLDVWKDEERWAEVVASGSNGEQFWNGHFREFIVAAPGYYLLTFDFSQIELRVLAGVSHEPALLRAFAEDVDVHRATAAQMLGKSVESVNDKERQDFGKRLNFALLYQEGPLALSEQLGVPVERAKQLMAQYFSAFSKVSSWQDQAVARGLATGYAETPFKRRVQVWELKSEKPGIVAKGKRLLVNAPIQGGAADYMKAAMVKVAARLRREGWWREKVMLVMNQHDSLTFECSNELDPNDVRSVIAECVTFPVAGFPKITADWELGQSWGGANKWADERAEWDGRRWSVGNPPAVEKPVDDVEPLGTVTAVSAVRQRESLSTVNGTASVVVHTTRNPDRESFGRLLSLVASLPGETEVVLKCPAGEVTLGTSSLSMSDSGRVSLILGGAMMTASASADDLQAIGAGLSL
jgi:DNA polymerase-1